MLLGLSLIHIFVQEFFFYFQKLVFFNYFSFRLCFFDDDVKMCIRDRDLSASHYFLQPCSCANTEEVIAYILQHPEWRLSLQTDVYKRQG